MAKASLSEMAELIQEFADQEGDVLKSIYEQFPDKPPLPHRERRVFVLTSTAHLLRVLGTFEEDARRFVAGLLKRYGTESGR